MTFEVGDRVVVSDVPSGFGPGTIVKDLHGSEFHKNKVYGVRFDSYLSYQNSSDYHVAKVEALSRVQPSEDFGVSVQEVVNEVRDTLIAKNKAYGNSALEPVRVFSTADPVEQIRVRIDDKLSRLKSSADDNEDTVLDLMGYLVLLRIATRKKDSE